MARPRKTDFEYFQIDPSGCWRWLGATTPKGYGRKQLSRTKQVPAHRYFYEKHKGPIPPGLVLDHLCRNHICVNPKHLEIVTIKENVRRGDLTKLEVEDWADIRHLYSAGQGSQREIGELFGVDQSTVSRIVNYRREYASA